MPVTAGGSSLHADYLCSGEFMADNYSGAPGAYVKLQFQTDGTFSAEYNFGDHGPAISGKYSISNGTLDLSINNDAKTQYNSMTGLSLKTDKNYLYRKGKLIDDPASITYSRYILFSNGSRFYDMKSSPGKEGTEIMVEKIPAVLMGMKKAKATSNVKFRVKPDVKAGELTLDAGPENDPLKYIPAGDSFILLARTREKAKVQKWDNFWYYVEVPNRSGNVRGWVFGEFIEIR
jgi:hypothetical protein